MGLWDEKNKGAEVEHRSMGKGEIISVQPRAEKDTHPYLVRFLDGLLRWCGIIGESNSDDDDQVKLTGKRRG